MSDNNPDIFRTPVVTAGWDVFWQELPAYLKGMATADTVVISTVFSAGSPEEQQLQKMLGACKLEGDQYHVLQLEEGERLAWHKIREQWQPGKVLLLGIMPEQLGISVLFAAHEVNNFDQVQWMPTVSLSQLLQDNNLKQHLWTNVLRKVYFGG